VNGAVPSGTGMTRVWQTPCTTGSRGNRLNSQSAKGAVESMQPQARVATRSRPNRVLVALAAAWMILSLAIGGAVHADSSAQADPAPAVAGSTQD
jgi:hypothetical protein